MSEHHASEDGYLPAPLTMAAAIAAVTSRTTIMVAAALLPLYDPVRLAEEMIVLDHLSRGRVMYTLGLGYRPVEYELLGSDFSRRGAIADEKLGRAPRPPPGGVRRICVPSRAPPLPSRRTARSSPGEGPPPGRPPERAGTGWASSPRPTIPPSPRSTRRRRGPPVTPPGCASSRRRTHPHRCSWPPTSTRAGGRSGEALLVDAISYRSWNEEAGNVDANVTLTPGATVAELRAANGSHRVVSVADAVALIRRFGALGLQPLCGGLDPAVAWPYLRRVVHDVLPAVGSTRR